MFEILELKTLIKYATFNEICEMELNKEGEIR